MPSLGQRRSMVLERLAAQVRRNREPRQLPLWGDVDGW